MPRTVATWQVLGNFITVMRLFSTVRPPQSAAVLELRRQQQGAKGMELQLRRDQARPPSQQSPRLAGSCKHASRSLVGCPPMSLPNHAKPAVHRVFKLMVIQTLGWAACDHHLSSCALLRVARYRELVDDHKRADGPPVVVLF